MGKDHGGAGALSRQGLTKIRALAEFRVGILTRRTRPKVLIFRKLRRYNLAGESARRRPIGSYHPRVQLVEPKLGSCGNHKILPGEPVPKILVSGTSGPIGAALLPALEKEEFSVTRLVRGSHARTGDIPWEASKPLPPESVSGFEAVVHLAGESIVGRWTAAKKRKILDSRIEGTGNLIEALMRAPQPPRVMVTASAIGYYGDRGEERLREDSAPGEGFLPEVCRQWEASAQMASKAGIRSVQTRFGLVLSSRGGALPKMLPAFRMGVGGKVGSGRQWWSWVQVEDVAGAILHALKTEVSGPVDVVAPNPATNAEFTKVLGQVLSRPTMFPVPAFAARLIFGQMADELLLASQRVEPAKLQASNYQFRFPNLKEALSYTLKK